MTREGLYNYIEFLIKEARILIAQRNYSEAVWRCLIESQDGGSGWRQEVDELFRKPQTPQDVKLRNKLKDINLLAAKGLLNGISMVDRYLLAADVRAAEICFSRLNKKDISPEMSAKLQKLIAECENFGF